MYAGKARSMMRLREEVELEKANATPNRAQRADDRMFIAELKLVLICILMR